MIPAFEYRNRVVFDPRAQHKSSGPYVEYLKNLRLLFAMKGAKINVLKTTKIDSRRHKVDFRSASRAVKNPAKFFRKLKDNKLTHVYGVLEIHNASVVSVAILQKMAPTPSSITPFLLPRRFTVFFTICPPNDCFLVVAHVDKNGSGPLVFGPSVTGAFTSIAVCAPDYSKSEESIPPEIENVFSSTEVSVTPCKSDNPVHVVNMNASGAHVMLPAGCWHSVRTHGCSIRVGYYFQQRD